MPAPAGGRGACPSCAAQRRRPRCGAAPSVGARCTGGCWAGGCWPGGYWPGGCWPICVGRSLHCIPECACPHCARPLPALLAPLIAPQAPWRPLGLPTGPLLKHAARRDDASRHRTDAQVGALAFWGRHLFSWQQGRSYPGASSHRASLGCLPRAAWHCKAVVWSQRIAHAPDSAVRVARAAHVLESTLSPGMRTVQRGAVCLTC